MNCVSGYNLFGKRFLLEHCQTVKKKAIYKIIYAINAVMYRHAVFSLSEGDSDLLTLADDLSCVYVVSASQTNGGG